MRRNVSLRDLLNKHNKHLNENCLVKQQCLSLLNIHDNVTNMKAMFWNDVCLAQAENTIIAQRLV